MIKLMKYLELPHIRWCPYICRCEHFSGSLDPLSHRPCMTSQPKSYTVFKHKNVKRSSFLEQLPLTRIVGVDTWFASQISWAFFARMTPGLADGGTAELLGADDPLKLTRAHVVLHSSEKQIFSNWIIWRSGSQHVVGCRSFHEC